MKAFFNSQNQLYRSPTGAMQTGSSVSFRLDLTECDTPSSVSIRIWENDKETLVPMTVTKKNDGFVCKASVTLPETPCLFWYYFIIESNGERLIYANTSGLGGEGGFCEGEIKSFQITVYKKDFDTPKWFRGKIMYQIFPDRFYGVHENGKIDKKRDEYIIHYDRYEPISFNPHPFESGPACNDFYGGNLKGITEKLPYLKSLGIGVIYLNPIFDAYSNHKYDTADYKKIDPMFGDEEDFKTLCAEALKLDIRIILDGVFSHTGSDSVYFNKYKSYGEGGAYNDQDSPYRSWYGIREDNSYDSWWGCSNLPNVNEMEPSYLDYILRDDNSVIKKWLRLGASGWRLDVADELPDEFIEILRTEAKKEKPDALILGEVWEDASCKVAYSKQRKYLLGDELDSVMNYPFKEGFTAFIMGWKNGEKTNAELMSIMENYPLCVLYSLMNLVGTHDTMRIKSLLGGLNPDCASTELTSGMEDLATNRLKCLMFIQMTFVGVPSIYYGDEIGMQGGRDPFNRQPYPWRRIDAELLKTVKSLCRLRNETQVLQTGYYKTLYAKEVVFVYARYSKNGKDVFGDKISSAISICGINRGFEPVQISLDLSDFEFDKLYKGIDEKTEILCEDKKIELSLPPVGFVHISGKLL